MMLPQRVSWPETVLAEGPPHVLVEAGQLDWGHGEVTVRVSYPRELTPPERLELVKSNWRIELHRADGEIEYSVGGNGEGGADSFTYAEEFGASESQSAVCSIHFTSSLLGDWVLQLGS